MARPKKAGIDYFPLDVDAFNDDKLVSVMAEHGQPKTVYIWVRLLCELYRVGCCYRWDDRAIKSFALKVGLKPTEIAKIVLTMTEEGLFDFEVLDEHGFLTSKAIQRRFFYSVRGRKEVKLPLDVLLLEEDELPDSILIIDSKVKNSIEHNRNRLRNKCEFLRQKPSENSKSPKKEKEILIKCGKHYLQMTEEQKQKLIAKFSMEAIKREFPKMDFWIHNDAEGKAAKYRRPSYNHYLFAGKWLTRSAGQVRPLPDNTPNPAATKNLERLTGLQLDNLAQDVETPSKKKKASDGAKQPGRN